LDGTVLDGRGRVTAAVAAALRAVSARGTHLVVATGKARPAALAALAPSGLSAPLGGLVTLASAGVFLNGGLVHRTGGSVIYSRTLEAAQVSDALELAAAAGIPACAFTGDTCVALAPSPLLDELHTRYFEPLSAIAPSLPHLLEGPPVVKVLLYAHTAAAIDGVRPAMEALMAGRAAVVQAVPEMLEILPLGASKGDGCARLLRALGVPAQRAAAIGDGENDVAMLQAVGLGLAMANAAPVARAAARHTLSCGNEEDGVVEAIERFLL
jgi:Cof subfamily protein (haloacid dehalogenase superfamily)